MCMKFISTNIYLQSPKWCLSRCVSLLLHGLFPRSIYLLWYVCLLNERRMTTFNFLNTVPQVSPFFPLKCRVEGKWTVTSGGTYVNSQRKAKIDDEKQKKIMFRKWREKSSIYYQPKRNANIDNAKSSILKKKKKCSIWETATVWAMCKFQLIRLSGCCHDIVKH